jgi:hypothetical protein
MNSYGYTQWQPDSEERAEQYMQRMNPQSFNSGAYYGAGTNDQIYLGQGTYSIVSCF